MEIVDKRIFKGKRLKFLSCCDRINIFTHSAADYTDEDRMIQVEGNSVIYHNLLTQTSLKFNTEHTILQALYIDNDNFGAIHTDGNKLYMTVKNTKGESKTFPIDTTKVQLFDDGLIYQTASKKWQVIPKRLTKMQANLISFDNTTQLEKQLQDTLPQFSVDTKVYGVYQSPIKIPTKTDICLITDENQAFFHNNTQQFLRVLPPELRQAIQNEGDVEGSWKSAKSLLLKVGTDLYTWAPSAQSSDIKKIAEDVDKIVDAALPTFVSNDKAYVSFLATYYNPGERITLPSGMRLTQIPLDGKLPTGMDIVTDAGCILTYDNYDFDYKENSASHRKYFKEAMFRALSNPLLDMKVRKIFFSDVEKLNKIFWCQSP